MTYKDYFEELNSVICEFSNDELSMSDANTLISNLNERAANSDNSTLVKFLVNPANELKRASIFKILDKEIDSESYNSHDEDASMDYSHEDEPSYDS